jgi:hypothetical protein
MKTCREVGLLTQRLRLSQSFCSPAQRGALQSLAKQWRAHHHAPARIFATGGQEGKGAPQVKAKVFFDLKRDGVCVLDVSLIRKNEPRLQGFVKLQVR